MWVTIIIDRYLGVYLVSAKMFTCATDNAKKSFYRLNSISGKIGRAASEHCRGAVENQMSTGTTVSPGSLLSAHLAKLK